MLKSTMQKMYQTLLEEARKEKTLQDLLVDFGHEDQRPRIKLDGREYVLGTFDGRLMLRDAQGMLRDPNDIASIHEITWKLQP